MENLSLEMAYARYGAGVTSRTRNLASIANDGSLVLTCFGGRFSRPKVGVMRYDATISQESGTPPTILALRNHIEAALAAGTVVHPVMVAPASAATPRRVFVRPDLAGTVVACDGDKFTVDFVRLEPVDPPPARRKR